MTFAQIWNHFFYSFIVFVSVGLVWLGLIEPRLPSRRLSVTLMIIVAVAAAGVRFYYGCRSDLKQRRTAEAEIEAAYARDEEEVG